MKNTSSFKTDSFGQKQPQSSTYRRRGPQGNEYGRWVRHGSTVVVHLPENLPEEIQFEFELDREAALPTLRRGSRGSSVQTLQTRLNARGHDPGTIDGIFGSRTDAAVKAFQRASGIAPRRHRRPANMVGFSGGAAFSAAKPPWRRRLCAPCDPFVRAILRLP